MCVILLVDGLCCSTQDVETVGSAVSAVSEPERAKQSSSKSWEKQKKKKKGKAAASKPKKKQQLAKSNRKNAVVSKVGLSSSYSSIAAFLLSSTCC